VLYLRFASWGDQDGIGEAPIFYRQLRDGSVGLGHGGRPGRHHVGDPVIEPLRAA
jgi:hypothetical protein